MKRLIYACYTGLILCSGMMVHAQQEESMVVLSEENIVSLTNALRKYKKQQQQVTTQTYDGTTTSFNTQEKTVAQSTFEIRYLRQEIALLEQELLLRHKNTTSSSPSNDLALQNINTQLEELRFALQQLQREEKNATTVIVAPSTKSQPATVTRSTETIREVMVPVRTETVREVLVPATAASAQNELAFKKLQRKMDSMYAFAKAKQPQAAPLTTSNNDTNFKALQKELAALKAAMIANNQATIAAANAQKTTTLIPAKTTTTATSASAFELLKAQFKDYEKRVFFANNSTSLSPAATQSVQEIYDLLNSHENLDVVVKGFASNTGNIKQNETLSMQRTEAIKKALILRGVHPNRVLTQYHGIDYSAQNAANARRVELSFLIRK